MGRSAKSTRKAKAARKKTHARGRTAPPPKPKAKAKKRVPSAPSEEELFSQLVNNCPDAIIVTDLDRKVRFLNPAAEHLLGIPAKKLIGGRFNYPIDVNRPQEASITHPRSESLIAEMLATETKWKGEKSYLICLRDVTERVRLQDQLRALSSIDPLTGLLNRRGFLDAARSQISLAQRTKREMVLLFIDLDNLKAINDTQGHLEGDQTILESAKILRKTFRKPDLIGRFGGDEFSVLAIEASGKNATHLADRLQATVTAANRRKTARKRISFSVGHVKFDPDQPVSIEDLIDEADARMYQNKRLKARRDQV